MSCASVIKKIRARAGLDSPILTNTHDGRWYCRHHVESAAKVVQAEMSGHHCPARELEQIARTDGDKRILNVVGRCCDANAGFAQFVHRRQPSRRRLVGLPALQEKIGGRQRHNRNVILREFFGNAPNLRGRKCAQGAAMSRGDSALHAVRARALDHRIEQRLAALKMLVDVHVKREPAAFGKLKEKIEENQRFVGILRHSADGIGARRDGASQPIAAIREFAGRIAREVRDYLKRQSVAAAFAQSDHAFQAAQSAVRFDIGVTADCNRSARKTHVQRALGPGRNVLARGCCGKSPIAGRCTFKRCSRILHETARVRFIEMLMKIDQTWRDQLAVKLDHPVGGVAGDGRRHRCNAAVPAHRNV